MSLRQGLLHRCPFRNSGQPSVILSGWGRVPEISDRMLVTSVATIAAP